jgi:Flp pilus assembly pilin Flp
VKLVRRLHRNERGVAAIEMAFALPIVIVLIWIVVQLAEVYRAMSGIQQGLGEGARYATLCLDPTPDGCTTPAPEQIVAKINSAVYGIAPGHFSVATPVLQTQGPSAKYYDLAVTYTQHTSLLLFPGPDIHVTRSKRVWVASD